MLLSIDGTLIVQLLNFLVFLFVLNAIFFKPVGAVIIARRAYIDSVAADIERFSNDVKSLRAQGDDRVAQARRSADALIAESRGQAQREAAAILGDHTEQATAIIAQAQATVALEIAQARERETEVVDSLARTMLERAVGPELVR